MRTSAIVAAVLVFWGTVPAPLLAGVYCTTEPPDGPQPEHGVVKPLPLGAFTVALSKAMDRRNPGKDKNEERKHYQTRKAELEAKVQARTATLQERSNLGAYLIGLGEYNAAIKVLEEAVNDRSQRQNNFRIYANLGTANQIIGQLERAEVYLSIGRQLLRDTPPGDGLTKEQLDWYRKAEDYQKKLLRERRKQAAAAPLGGAKRGAETLDDLFGVQFVGPSGKYEAGKIAEAEQAKLPPDALAVVQQLILWLPDASGLLDLRLNWLMAELLNARGDLREARKLIADPAWTLGYNPPNLREHLQILEEALQPPPPPPLLPETPKLVAVGGITGAIVLFLGYLQVREMRRRRAASQ